MKIKKETLEELKALTNQIALAKARADLLLTQAIMDAGGSVAHDRVCQTCGEVGKQNTTCAQCAV